MNAVWSFREVRRDAWVILRDSTEWAMVTTVGERQHESLRAMTRALAQLHGGVFDDHTIGGVDWRALGWTDEAEHRAHVAEVAAVVASWANSPLAPAITGYVNTAKRDAGIPTSPPYTLDQLDELDRIVRRAPAIVAQDHAAEVAA